MRLCKHYVNKFEEMSNLYRLCQAFYQLPNCGAGGPLHILLDDDNYDDESIKFCIEQCKENPDSMESRLGLLICDEYSRLSLEERCIFDWYWTGKVPGCEDDWDCKTCELLYEDELYGRMKESEERQK